MTPIPTSLFTTLRAAEAGWAGLTFGLCLIFWPWHKSREARQAASVWGGAAKGSRYERIAGIVIAVLSIISLAAN